MKFFVLFMIIFSRATMPSGHPMVAAITTAEFNSLKACENASLKFNRVDDNAYSYCLSKS